jgi:hypothetical protein
MRSSERVFLSQLFSRRRGVLWNTTVTWEGSGVASKSSGFQGAAKMGGRMTILNLKKKLFSLLNKI